MNISVKTSEKIISNFLDPFDHCIRIADNKPKSLTFCILYCIEPVLETLVLTCFTCFRIMSHFTELPELPELPEFLNLCLALDLDHSCSEPCQRSAGNTLSLCRCKVLKWLLHF